MEIVEENNEIRWNKLVSYSFTKSNITLILEAEYCSVWNYYKKVL